MQPFLKLKIPVACVLMFIVLEGFFMGGFYETTLNDFSNKPFNFSQIKSNKAVVVIFLLADCPASQSYTLTLNSLADKYSKDSVKFIGVFPGSFSTDEELNKFKEEYKISFKLLKDPEMKLAKLLHATTAPGCFVIDNKAHIAYKGRIDDWLYAIGKTKPSITEHNLDEAIHSVLNDLPVKNPETNPIGCILEYE